MNQTYPAECVDTTLLFLNHPHKAAQVYAAAKAAPRIDVEIKDLLLDHIDTPQFKGGRGELLNNVDLLIYKYQGRWLVLMGVDKVKAALTEGSMVIKGALISTPSLKKCRILPVAPSVTAPASATPFNPPRFATTSRPTRPGTNDDAKSIWPRTSAARTRT